VSILKFSSEGMGDFLNHVIDINLSMMYAEDKPGSGAMMDNVKFSYTPTKLYTPKVMNIGQSIKVDQNQIKLGEITIHSLYTSIEVEAESSDSSVIYIFKRSEWCKY
jgi:hypothetical protein